MNDETVRVEVVSLPWSVGKDVLTAEETAALLSFNARTTRDMLKTGEIPGHKLRGEWRVSRRELLRHIESLPVGDAD